MVSQKIDNYFIYVRCAVYNNQKEYILCRILDVGKQFMGLLYLPEDSVPKHRIFGKTKDVLKLKCDIWLIEKGFNIKKIG